MVEFLPVYKIKGKFYFLDKKLSEYRNVKNPFDILKFDEISLKDLDSFDELKDRFGFKEIMRVENG